MTSTFCSMSLRYEPIVVLFSQLALPKEGAMAFGVLDALLHQVLHAHSA